MLHKTPLSYIITTQDAIIIHYYYPRRHYHQVLLHVQKRHHFCYKSKTDFITNPNSKSRQTLPLYTRCHYILSSQHENAHFHAFHIAVLSRTCFLITYLCHGTKMPIFTHPTLLYYEYIVHIRILVIKIKMPTFTHPILLYYAGCIFAFL